MAILCVCCAENLHPRQSQAIIPLTEALTSGIDTGYLDLVPTAEGFNHVALFSPATSSTPRFLTKGDWEVTEILGVDPHKRLV